MFPRHTSNWYWCVLLWLVLLLWRSVIRENIAMSWGNRRGFDIGDKMYVFMNILLMVYNQEETDDSLLSEQKWQEMLQSKTCLLSIVYMIGVNVYYRHTYLAKVFHTYPHLAQSLKQYKYDTNKLQASIHWACHSVHIHMNYLQFIILIFN